CSALHPLSLLAPASTDLYTLPLHDALPISLSGRRRELHQLLQREPAGRRERQAWQLGLGAASGRGLQAEPELVPERRPQEGADPCRRDRGRRQDRHAEGGPAAGGRGSGLPLLIGGLMAPPDGAQRQPVTP